MPARDAAVVDLAKDGPKDGSPMGRDTGVGDGAIMARDTAVVDVPVLPGDTASPSDGAGCSSNGRSYPVGASFPSSDGCNTCTCLVDGPACTAHGCQADAAVMACALTPPLTFGFDGGMRLYSETAVLADVLTLTRTYRVAVDGGAVRSCVSPLPACQTAGQLDVGDIAADLISPDVTAAFALPDPAVFGVDPRAYDGALFAITNGTGKTIYVGDDCPSPAMSSCRPVPAGVKTLSMDLQALFTHARSSAACAGL